MILDVNWHRCILQVINEDRGSLHEERSQSEMECGNVPGHSSDRYFRINQISGI